MMTTALGQQPDSSDQAADSAVIAPPVSPDFLHSLAEDCLDTLMRSHPLPRRPKIEWRGYRTTAGTANANTFTIALSKHVLDDADKLRSTFVHEYAHLLAFARFGRRGLNHGPAWQQAMRDLGADPQVYHRYDCQRNQPRQIVEYTCSNCGIVIPRKRKLPRNRKYLHRNCGGTIALHAVKEVEQTQKGAARHVEQPRVGI